VNAQDTSAEPKPDLPLEIAHILLIDVVGYSNLLVNEQIEVLQELKQIVRSTGCFRAAEARGELIRVPTGDGMALVFFHSPEEPAQCALEISKALQDHPSIQVRMGIHSGPVGQVTDVNDRTNIAGAGINVAQRVLDCGDAGHILLSAHVAEDLCEYRHWQPCLDDLGECEVKYGLRLHLFNLYKDGLGNPQVPEKLRRGRRKQAAAVSVRPITTPSWPKYVFTAVLLVSAVALAISFSVFYRRGSPAVARSSSGKATDVGLPIAEKSIAVLPFENRSEDKANAYFAEGIQDEILTRLSKIADLKVISRTSTQHYKSAPENLTEIGKQLGVAHIVEGSVQKSGDAVRVNVRLIKATNDSQLWADTIDRPLTEILSVESEVAVTVADQLRAKITGEEAQLIAAKPTYNPQAYDAYLHGLAYTLRSSGFEPRNVIPARQYLEEAVRIDPKFALGWSLLSSVDSAGYITGTLPRTTALRDEARIAAETALKLQPNLGEAVSAKAFYHYVFLKDYDTASRYFEQATRLLPSDSRIPEALAFVERRRGDWEQSEAYFNRAERLDPRNVRIIGQHAVLYKILRRFPDALRKCEDVLNITPDDPQPVARQAAIFQAMGDLPRASALLTPLYSRADDGGTMNTQVYQAILERRTAPIIPRLKEMLSKPDSVPGDSEGELRFWLGWAQDIAGDHAGAHESWMQAKNELESSLKEQPESYLLIGALALTEMKLGENALAMTLADRGLAVNPIEKDAMNGPLSLEVFARVTAATGDHDRSIAALKKLLSIPYEGPLPSHIPLTPALLKLDPMFDPLRNDLRFQKLAASTTPKPADR
jgi:TolB-like protein/class 3 adenylate cyclase/Tfp pilus assembly protein PilF